jgi:DNA-binding HxlR family transcriptional regulator
MKKATGDDRRSGCPISLALELVGDAWTLLIVRDLMFKGRTTFGEFQASEEKIATSVLTDRLARLLDYGIVEKKPDPGDRRRLVYGLTERGIDLAPTLVDLVLWADRYEDTDAPPDQIAFMRDDRDGFLAFVRDNWRKTRGDE